MVVRGDEKFSRFPNAVLAGIANAWVISRMPTILCFGDSNTWGYDPAATAASPFPIRYPADVRWPGQLAGELGNSWQVIEEGQNGRAAVHEDRTALASRCGRDYLLPCLESHHPLEVVAIMLGTNDLKACHHLPAQDIANGVGVLVQLILKSGAGPGARAPKILVICPAAIGNLESLPDLAARFVGARERSLEMPRLYAAMAKLHGVEFLNAQEYTQVSPIDGLHFTAEDHTALAKAVAAKLRSMM